MAKSKSEADAQLIRTVAGRLAGIYREDMTTAESQIVDLLIGGGYLREVENGELTKTEER